MYSLDNVARNTIAEALAGGKGEELSPLTLRLVNEYLKWKRMGQISSARGPEFCHAKQEPFADDHQ